MTLINDSREASMSGESLERENCFSFAQMGSKEPSGRQRSKRVFLHVINECRAVGVDDYISIGI